MRIFVRFLSIHSPKEQTGRKVFRRPIASVTRQVRREVYIHPRRRPNPAESLQPFLSLRLNGRRRMEGRKEKDSSRGRQESRRRKFIRQTQATSSLALRPPSVLCNIFYSSIYLALSIYLPMFPGNALPSSFLIRKQDFFLSTL